MEMPRELTRRFIEALGTLEASRDAGALVDLFADDAEVGNVLVPEAYHGREGAREFWEQYRGHFGEVRSTFRNVIDGEGRVALEWTTTGTSAAGAPIAYDGVSLLEIGGGRISRFSAYFDSASLGREMREAAPGRRRA
jgi:ketosteroid isomerase-like protein